MARLRPRTLRTKFLWGGVLITCLVMIALIAVVEHRQRAAIIDEVRRRGEVVARNLAALSEGPLLLYNFTALEQNVAQLAADDDVEYAIVLDADGQVAAHSQRPELVGLALDDAPSRAASASPLPLVQETPANVYDFSNPVTVGGQRWGTVRVGLSRSRMEREIQRTRWELSALALAALLLGGGAAGLVARRIARPVRELAAGADAIARGDLDQRIEPATTDEIGRLADAFNHMAAQLRTQRAALERAHGELRHRFEELADLKGYTDNILASLTTGIVTVNLDGRVVTLNPAAELLTGYFAGEVVGRYCTEVFAHTAEIGEILMETLASRTPAPELALTFRRRNGTTLALEFSAAPLKGGEGKDLGVIGLFRDLTAVRELERQLERSDRLAALGTLAAGLAHEIKNPLTSLLTFSRHLSRKFDDEEFRRKFQSVVPRELERINGIVEGLLELARPPRLSLTRVRLPALLERVLELSADQLEAQGIRVSREYARDLPAITADEDALHRALLNLITNAVQAMPEGGRLTLRLGWTETTGARRAPRGRRLKVEVGDSGSGIPVAHHERVFTPFFTTKEQGTGLGLALTHKIVEDHGGTIDFVTAQLVGTTFRIVLPLVADAPPEGARAGEDL